MTVGYRHYIEVRWKENAIETFLKTVSSLQRHIHINAYLLEQPLTVASVGSSPGFGTKQMRSKKQLRNEHVCEPFWALYRRNKTAGALAAYCHCCRFLHHSFVIKTATSHLHIWAWGPSWLIILKGKRHHAKRMGFKSKGTERHMGVRWKRMHCIHIRPVLGQPTLSWTNMSMLGQRSVLLDKLHAWGTEENPDPRETKPQDLTQNSSVSPNVALVRMDTDLSSVFRELSSYTMPSQCCGMPWNTASTLHPREPIIPLSGFAK